MPSPHGSARRAAVLASAIALVGTLAACGGSDSATEDGDAALVVVATTTHGADFARAVGGSRVEVVQLLQPNVDPHDYEPTPADLVAIGSADVLVSNGVGLEGWLADSISASGFAGTEIVMAEGVELRTGGHTHGDDSHSDDSHGDQASAEHAHEDEESGEHAEEQHTEGDGHDHEHDPHIWHDPRNAKIMVANIERGLSAADPEGSAEYRANLATYTAQLDELDREIQQKIDAIPPDRRKLVTSHNSLGYYAERYGLEYVGSIIPSFDSSAELSGRAIDQIVKRIRATGTVAVFAEASLPPRTADTIGREAGVRVIAGENALYTDSLGPEGSPGATYVAAQRHNTDTIVSALR